MADDKYLNYQGLETFWSKIKQYVANYVNQHGGGASGDFLPISGGEVTGNLQVDGLLDIKNSQPKLAFTTSNNDYVSYIQAYDQGLSPAAGHNMVIRSGGNIIIGGGESPSAIYDAVNNGTLTDFSKTSEALALSADNAIHVYTNCNTFSSRNHLLIGTDGSMYTYSNDMDNTYNVTLDQNYSKVFAVYDKNKKVVGRFTGRQQSDGSKLAMLEAYGFNSTNTGVWNSFCVGVDKTGTRYYTCSDKTKFRSDMGINYSTLGIVPRAQGGTQVNNNSVAINKVFAGPSSGNAGNATFRAIVANDLPVIPISKGGTGKTTAAEARSALGVTRANLGGISYQTVFSSLNVASGGVIGTNTAVFNYRYFMATLTNGCYTYGYRTGSTSASGNIYLVGGKDLGNGAHVELAQIAVDTKGKCTYIAGGEHSVGSGTALSKARNITGLFGLI